MKNKVTYAIEYTKSNTLADGYNFYIEQYKQQLNNGKQIKAAQLIIELIEWLVDADDDNDEFLQYLDQAIKFCRKVVKSLKEVNYPFLLAKAYSCLSQAYSIQEIFDQAIHYGLESIQLLQSQQKQDEDAMDIDQPKIKLALQFGYRLLGNIYFNKGLHPKASRYSDYQHALQFYTSEREVIDTMTLTDMDSTDEDDLTKLRQSSHFNMGVMERKLPDHYTQANDDLKSALKLAQQLKDPQSEKNAWWELGNLYKTLGDHEAVKRCQASEHSVALHCGLKEDVIICFEERIKYHLYLGEFNACMKLYKKLLGYVDDDAKEACRSFLKMVKQVKALREELDRLIDKGDLNAQIATKFLTYIRLLNYYELYRVLIQTIDTSFIAITNTRDFSPLIYAQILHIKTEALWHLNESTKEAYLQASNEAYDYVEASLSESPLNQYMLMIDIFQLRVQIYEYFELDFQKTATEKVLADAIKQEKLLRYKLENNLVGVNHLYSRITPSFNQLSKKKIQVKIMAKPPVEFSMIYDHAPETVRFLMNDIASQCWNTFGFEPNISHVRTLDHDILPEDLVNNVVIEDGQHLEVHIHGIAKKTPLELYLNASRRLEIAPIKAIEYAMEMQNVTDISFMGLNIKANHQFDLVQQILEHSTALYRLNLSSNSLVNEDLEKLLKIVNPSVGEVRLGNNQLTTECLDTLTKLRVATLDLSHNPIDATLFVRLPQFLEKVPVLKRLELENTDIGKINMDVCHATQTKSSLNMSSSLTLDVSNNHFEQDMLSKLTELWLQFNRIEGLELSSITSDFGWNNFDLLSELSSLSKLSFKYSVKTTFGYCHFKEFFMMKKTINELDLTGCGLDLEDMVMFGYSLSYIDRLNRLMLNSNPNIGDAGIKYLDAAIEKSKIISISLSHCGLTNESSQLIIRWTRYLKMLDITHNAIFDQDTLPSNSTAVMRLDPIKPAPTIRTPSMSFQSLSDLPDSPFD
ncbi:hypothetical protein EDC96DRAFT_511105 [Choanephora cucurbitarum]|nr:hypothetical protein EDC96DRAFT_511105 [Choanephora cucurbitarum]